MQSNYAKIIVSSLIAATMLLLATTSDAAGSDVCSTASLVNPNIDGGMGGTGIVADGGAGGTGIVAEGGAGGTGVVAVGGFGGTGDAVVARLLPQDTAGGIAIVGVVTGFASICINGEEVHYDSNTPVYDNGNATKISSIGTGQMVVLKADKVGDKLRARAIGLFDAVAGPIDKLDIKRAQMEVMGQIVQLDQMTMQQMRALDAGATVRVSGHRLANGEIVATKVGVSGASRDKTQIASTIGIVTSITPDGFVVNGTKVSVDKALLGNMKVGNEVRVGGHWDGIAIKPNRIEAQPISNLINRADRAIMEGFAQLEGSSGVSVSGTELVINKVNASYKNIASSHGKVVKVELHKDNNGNLVCDKVEQRKGQLFKLHSRKTANNGLGDDSSDDVDSSSGSSSNAGSGSENSGSDSSGSGSSGSRNGSENSGSKSSGKGSSGSGSGSNDSGSNSVSGPSGRSSTSGSSGGSSAGSARSSGSGASSGGSSGGSGHTSGGGSSGGSGKNK